MTQNPRFDLTRSDLPAHLRPEGRARKFTLEVATSFVIPSDAGLSSGGTHEHFEAVTIAEGRATAMPMERSAPWSRERRDRHFAMLPGVAIRVTSSFCGKAAPTKFVVHPDDFAKVLPHAAAPAVALGCDARQVHAGLVGGVAVVRASQEADCADEVAQVLYDAQREWFAHRIDVAEYERRAGAAWVRAQRGACTSTVCAKLKLLGGVA